MIPYFKEFSLLEDRGPLTTTDRAIPRQSVWPEVTDRSPIIIIVYIDRHRPWCGKPVKEE